MHDPADPDLLRRFAAGDREAFAVLVARHHGLVDAACRRQAPSGDAEDCVQAAFLILARKPAAALRAPVLEAWLQRVATFVCRTARRSAQRRQQAERAAVQPGPPAGGGRNEALDHLDDCLLQLPAKQRAALTLHYLAGKPPEEVAQALGTNRNHTYQLISRGLIALRVLLARRGVAVSGTALASLLTSEAQAAAVTAPTTVVTALTATPTAGAATLAQGAMSAMTIAVLAPVAAAAGLVLTAGTLTLALAAEPATKPVPASTSTSSASTPANASAPATKPVAPVGVAATSGASPALRENLKVPVSCNFQGMELRTVCTFLTAMSGVAISLGDGVAGDQTISLAATDLPLAQVLRQIAASTGLQVVEQGDAIILRQKAK